MKKTMLVGLGALAVMLSGCGAGAEETPTPEMEDAFVPVVAVAGEVVPSKWATVSAQTGGRVEEVTVDPSDEVAEDDVLVRLDASDAQLAVQEAEAAVASAQAQVALLEAGPRPEEVAVAEEQIEAAKATVSQAAAERDRLKAGATDAQIAAARANVGAARAEHLAAREAHDQTMKCYDVGGEEVCPLLGPKEEQARYNLHAANEALDAAQAQLDALVEGEDERIRAAEAAVWAAAKQRDTAQARLEALKAGASSERIATAEASVHQAKVALAAAKLALERTEIRAPFAGTIGMVQVRAGEFVSPGQPLAILGDLTALRVETTDLDEIDVARVKVGQEVDVTFDALSEQVFGGRVTRISPMADPGAGGVSYTTVIELDKLDPAIRWGMTAFVDIEVGE